MNPQAQLGTSANIDLSMFKGAEWNLARALVEIVHDLRKYLPLTVRQVYYRAVPALLIANHLNEYRRVSRNLTTLRREDVIPWHCIEDRTHRTIGKRSMADDVHEYIESGIESFLNPRHYGRCCIQDQYAYVEVATEKDALSSIVEDAVWMYCTRLNIVRGQVSATMVNQMAERFDRAIMLGKRPILLYLGDFDYSGVAIPRALTRNMAEHHHVDVELMRVVLNPDQIAAHGLPEDPEAGTPKEPNRDAFIAEYGNHAPVELDALHPADLTRITTAALEDVYDISDVQMQKDKEAEERELLGQMRRRVEVVAYSEWAEVFAGGRS